MTALITLSDGITTVELPYDLVWTDEFSWAATEQAVTRGLTGAPIVQVMARIAGRPITLTPPDAGGWMPRSTWSQIQIWLDAPGQRLTLTLRGVAHLVVFRHQDTGAEAEPLFHYADPDGADYVRPTFRFLTVVE